MCFIFFYHQYNADFLAFILHRFLALKKDVNRCARMRKPLKNFRISAQGFHRSQKQLKMGAFEGVFVIGVQLKRHNSGQCLSRWGLYVDTPRICLSWVSFGEGRTVWAL